MSEPIFGALIACIEKNRLLLPTTALLPKSKVALVGEYYNDHTLKQMLIEEYKVDVTEFTDYNLFKIEDGEQFDILIGCRPCEGDKVVLESATKYNKQFILLPCLCGKDPKRKSIDLIRQYSVVTHVDTCASYYYKDQCDPAGWMVLFNKPAWA